MNTQLVDRRRLTPLQQYDAAVQALEQASTLVETMHVRNVSEALKLLGKQARDGEAIARAAALRMRAERKLGSMLIDLKARGLLDRGGRPSKLGKAQDVTLLSLSEVGIDRKLSSAAQKLAEFDLDQFETVVSDALQKIRSGRAIVVNPGKVLSTADKKAKRAVREALLALKQSTLPDDVFQLILADPEWEDEDVWSDNGLERAPDQHYPTSSVEEIAARPVGNIAAKDSICLLWVPARHVARGNHVKVLAGWGFEPKAMITWDKVVAGTGYWVRNRSEILIIATRGHVPAPAMGTQWDDIIAVPKSPIHSRKPDFAHEWAETFFPGLKKIELNARRARPGWSAWGNEAPNELQGEPAALAGATPRPGEPGQSLSVAATPETGDGRLPSAVAPGAGEGAVSHALSRSDVDPAATVPA